MDAQITLCYGFKVTNKKLREKLRTYDDEEEVSEGDFSLPKGLTNFRHGDVYYEDGPHQFVGHSQSEKSFFLWEDVKLIDPKQLVVKSAWKKELLAFAKNQGLKNPKLGWWITGLAF
jgi:hypothetical protein